MTLEIAAEITIRSPDGKIIEKRELVTLPARAPLLKQAIVRYEANRRAGTASTKVRSQVVGSRRKPWRQKGTGRARSGDRRSPVWRGGGVVFGPHPRDFSQSLPRRARQEALADAIQGKARDGEIVGIEEFPTGEPLKTRRVVDLLKGLGLSGDSCLIVTGPEAGEGDAVFPQVHRMAKNLAGVSVTKVENLNAHDVLRHRVMLVSRAGIDFLFPSGGEEAGS